MQFKKLEHAMTAVHPGEEQTIMLEDSRFFSFTVTWHGNVSNKYLTSLLMKKVDAMLQQFAKDHPGVGNVSSINKVRSSGGW